jgi:hypothetical protein
MPHIKYFDWFIDSFRTLKKAKEVESELKKVTTTTTSAAGSGSRLLTQYFADDLKFGQIDLKNLRKKLFDYMFDYLK